LCLASVLKMPTDRRRGVAARSVLGVVLSLALAAGFYVARYGNDQFEFVRSTEVQALDWFYTHAPHGSTLASYEPVLPWRYRDVEAFRHSRYTSELGQGTEADIKVVAWQLRSNSAGGYVVLTTSQEQSGELNRGESPGWMSSLQNRMIRAGQFELVFHNRDAAILRVTPEPKGA
jgi:hypothetical protein